LHEVGAGLLLTPNAINVLENLGLRDACAARGMGFGQPLLPGIGELNRRGGE